MTPFTVEVQDAEVRLALAAFLERSEKITPFLQELGDGIMERAKLRFETSTRPDGVKWKELSDVTLGMLSDSLGKSYRKKSGDLNTKGERKISSRKPLVDTGELKRQIQALADAHSVSVVANGAYAAVHQFGAMAGRNRKVTIPARPFLPVMPDGGLYPEEKAILLQAINDYLMDF